MILLHLKANLSNEVVVLQASRSCSLFGDISRSYHIRRV